MADLKQVTVLLSADLLEEFKAYKAATGTSLSGLLRVLLSEKLHGEGQSLIQKNSTKSEGVRNESFR